MQLLVMPLEVTVSAERGVAEMPVEPDLNRYRLGIELRRFREAASLRLEDVAAALEVAPSTVSRIETGTQPVSASFIRITLRLAAVVTVAGEIACRRPDELSAR